jgi:hypothetical protein
VDAFKTYCLTKGVISKKIIEISFDYLKFIDFFNCIMHFVHPKIIAFCLSLLERRVKNIAFTLPRISYILDLNTKAEGKIRILSRKNYHK